MTTTKLKKKKLKQKKRGRSSAGRAPALHAGGREFESPRLHQEAAACIGGMFRVGVEDYSDQIILLHRVI